MPETRDGSPIPTPRKTREAAKAAEELQDVLLSVPEASRAEFLSELKNRSDSLAAKTKPVPRLELASELPRMVQPIIEDEITNALKPLVPGIVNPIIENEIAKALKILLPKSLSTALEDALKPSGGIGKRFHGVGKN